MTDQAAGYVTLDGGDRSRPPVNVRVITNPDPVLDRALALALALSPCPLPGVPVTACELADRLLELHLHMTTGRPAPTPWARDLTAADDQPVTDVALPAAGPPPGRLTPEELDGIRAWHRPVPSRRTDGAAFCAGCGRQMPCETTRLLNDLAAAWRHDLWYRQHQADLAQALTWAAGQVPDEARAARWRTIAAVMP